MYEEVQVLTHSSIRIAGNQIIYFDPFHVEEETHDADIICVTHEQYWQTVSSAAESMGRLSCDNE